MDGKKSSLADEEKSFIGPLMIVGGILVVVLLVYGLFMHTVTWQF